MTMKPIARFAWIILALLLTAEIAVRGRLWFRNDYVWDGDLFRYKAFHQVGDTLSLTTNNAGFFGDLLSVPKNPGVYRVFILGDSTVANPEIPRALREEVGQASLPYVFEVNSAGVPRYTSHHNMLLVEHYLMEWEPDCVVVYLGLNDNVYNTNPNAREMPPLGLWRWSNLSTSILGEMVWYYGVHKRFLCSPQFETLPSVPRFEHHLRRIVDTCRIHDVDVLLVEPALGYPTEDETLLQLIRANERPMRHFWGDLASALRGVEAHRAVMEKTAEDLGIPIVDADPLLPKNAGIFRDLCHFTSEGNALLGRVLAERILGFFFEKRAAQARQETEGTTF